MKGIPTPFHMTLIWFCTYQCAVVVDTNIISHILQKVDFPSLLLCPPLPPPPSSPPLLSSGGLLFGVVSAIIFVPYITFGKWDAFRKRILLVICLPLLILLFIAGFVTFYVIPDPSFCPWCSYINCVPYTSDICPDEYNNVNPEVFSLWPLTLTPSTLVVQTTVLIFYS